MTTSTVLTVAACFALGGSSFAAGTKPKAPAPTLTVKDLAIPEAKACDANHNGRIDGPEVSELRTAQSKNPKSYLYLFDANGDHILDDAEIAKIKLAPPKAAPPKKKK
jgi:hypothetical protein